MHRLCVLRKLKFLNVPASDAQAISRRLFFFSLLRPLTPAVFWGHIRNCHGGITLSIRFQGTINLLTEDDHQPVLVSPPALGALHTACVCSSGKYVSGVSSWLAQITINTGNQTRHIQSELYLGLFLYQTKATSRNSFKLLLQGQK